MRSKVHIIVLFAIALLIFILYQCFLPYHLFFKEQQILFLYTRDYLCSYLEKPAWLACLTGDFLTQLYYFSFGGALTFSIVLLLLGIVTYYVFNVLTGRKSALPIALLLMAIEALRHANINYELSSTIALLGGMGMFMIYFFINGRTAALITAIALLPAVYWMFGYAVWIYILLIFIKEVKEKRFILPLLMTVGTVFFVFLMRNYYLTTVKQSFTYPGIGMVQIPDMTTEKILALDCETYFGRPEKVIKIAEESKLKLPQISYFYNLAQNERGIMPSNLLKFYQPGPSGLFLNVGPSSSPLTILCSNEVWFQIGDMTMAEHSAILGMIFSPHSRNVRMIKRLAEINLIKGDSASALKYIRLLDKTWLYKEWANNRKPGKETPSVKTWLDNKRSLVSSSDTLRTSNEYVKSLRNLVNSHPNNKYALDYLLCYHLLTKNLDDFWTDYNHYCDKSNGVSSALYEQALLICMLKKKMDLTEVKSYQLSAQTVNEFDEYTRLFDSYNGEIARLQPKFGLTYWFYYHFATFEES